MVRQTCPLNLLHYFMPDPLVDAHAANERLSKTQLEKQAKDARGNPIEDPLVLWNGCGRKTRIGRKPSIWPVLPVEGDSLCDWPVHPYPPTKPPTKTEKPTHNRPLTKTEKPTHDDP